ncbi:bifunctional adenosylcobinamide kinase/adenosylcobinamide-phosphate guanylyltransferase [Nocardia bovistercoris]|uniref:Adenosylcobinamide kinase n=1 Tax=Nocardia bovistercoris TaxID=2785916 RepID=A0A931IEK0_9NOCA|nr:bifunctional adenosylcobinamide kinase/adenosylcobinamide-phosphate guanylyltransferase [Nocardia bovistercoris]
MSEVDAPRPDRPQRILVLGGARSGKSAYAEELAARAGAVRYVATAVPAPDDRDFAARIEAHRHRRPPTWHLVENTDPADVLATPTEGATLIDDIGTWLTACLDRHAAWDAPRGTITPQANRLIDAVETYPGHLVIVSPEVGMGVIPATRSGRLFRDEIGTINQHLARACDKAVLIVAGLPLHLK